MSPTDSLFNGTFIQTLIRPVSIRWYARVIRTEITANFVETSAELNNKISIMNYKSTIRQFKS